MDQDATTTPTGATPSFVPDRDAARALDAERRLRYRWAAGLAEGRRVLDAGCGSGDGVRVLAEAGAREVVGIDAAETVLDRAGLPAGARLDSGAIERLPYADGSFDLVACFGVLEHAADPRLLLEELTRVRAPGGLLALSWLGEEVALRGLLGPRLPELRLLRQIDLLVSAAVDGPLDDELAVSGSAGSGAVVRTLALAGDGPLPAAPPPPAVAAAGFEPRAWQAAFAAQADALQAAEVRGAELEQRLGEHDGLARELLESEQRSAAIPTLKLQIADLEYELGALREREASARDQVLELEQRLNRTQQTLVSVMTSPSWKLTGPLRQAKKLLGS